MQRNIARLTTVRIKGDTRQMDWHCGPLRNRNSAGKHRSERQEPLRELFVLLPGADTCFGSLKSSISGSSTLLRLLLSQRSRCLPIIIPLTRSGQQVGPSSFAFPFFSNGISVFDLRSRYRSFYWSERSGKECVNWRERCLWQLKLLNCVSFNYRTVQTTMVNAILFNY